MDTLTALCAISGWVVALIVNDVWHRQYKKMDAEWRKRYEHIDTEWWNFWMELLDEGAEPKDEQSGKE